MGIVKDVRAQLIRERQRNDALQEENRKLRAAMDYVAMMDYPELLDEEEESHE